MDNFLFDLIQEDGPKINRDVVDGLAVTALQSPEKYLDSVWREAAQNFPKGLSYEGFRYLTPREELFQSSKHAAGKSMMEIARTDTRMIAYRLSLNGQEIEHYVNVLIMYDAGITRIRGANYSICPVLADPAISVPVDTIFTYVLRDNLTFDRKLVRIMKGDRLVEYFVPWGDLHHQKKKQSKTSTTKPLTTLAHYLFAQYGVEETFSRYANAKPVAGTWEDFTDYDREQWTFYSSVGIAPSKARARRYERSDLVMAVRNDEVSPSVDNLMAGLFYVADFFPGRVTATDLNERHLWIVLLGICILGSDQSEGRLAENMQNHLTSLASYIDGESRHELGKMGIVVDDLFDYFAHLIDNATNIIVNNYENLASMFGKRLMVTRYVMRGLVAGINTFMYRVSANRRKQLTLKDVTDNLKEQIKTNEILKINKGHGEVTSSVTCPGDNKFFKITSRLCRQVKASRGAPQGSIMDDPSSLLHVSIAVGGNHLTPNGSSPSGHERINPFVKLGPEREILFPEEDREMIDATQELISRTI